MSDEQLRRLVNEELDRRERAAQQACRHSASGTLLQIGGDIRCDDCNKIMDDDDKANRYTGIPDVVGVLEKRSIR